MSVGYVYHSSFGERERELPGRHSRLFPALVESMKYYDRQEFQLGCHLGHLRLLGEADCVLDGRKETNTDCRFIGMEAGEERFGKKSLEDALVSPNPIADPLVEHVPLGGRERKDGVTLFQEYHIHQKTPNTPVPIAKRVDILETGMNTA